jgi:hypothetical protein
MDQREDGGVTANSQRQGEKRNRGEGLVGSQLAQSQ